MAEVNGQRIERVARAIARETMPHNMLIAPTITQVLYIDAVWAQYAKAAQAAIIASDQ